MNCWEILGIQPTSDRKQIREAYEGQLKFANEEEAHRLNQAFEEATGTAPLPAEPAQGIAGSDAAQSAEIKPVEAGAQSGQITAAESQVVREVIIQVKALLNDTRRSQDDGVWKAILCEPPADQDHLRREIARQLEPQLRPMAENGSFPAPVVHFLGNWFEWPSLVNVAAQIEDNESSDPEFSEAEQELPPQAVNFWPAVIGWIVGLAILASLFGGMGGG